MLNKYKLFLKDTWYTHNYFIVENDYESISTLFEREDSEIKLIFKTLIEFLGFIKILECDGYKFKKNIIKNSFAIRYDKKPLLAKIINKENEIINLEIKIDHLYYDFLNKCNYVVYLKHIFEHYDWWFVYKKSTLLLLEKICCFLYDISNSIENNNINHIYKEFKKYQTFDHIHIWYYFEVYLKNNNYNLRNNKKINEILNEWLKKYKNNNHNKNKAMNEWVEKFISDILSAHAKYLDDRKNQWAIW